MYLGKKIPKRGNEKYWTKINDFKKKLPMLLSNTENSEQNQSGIRNISDIQNDQFGIRTRIQSDKTSGIDLGNYSSLHATIPAIFVSNNGNSGKSNIESKMKLAHSQAFKNNNEINPILSALGNICEIKKLDEFSYCTIKKQNHLLLKDKLQ